MKNQIYFISDLHFGHLNSIKFDNRPFSSVEEMDEELIKRFNAVGAPDDTVYVLGDLFWHNRDGYAQKILKRLNKRIYLIKGNHDKWLHDTSAKKLLAGVADYKEIVVSLKDGTPQPLVLSHYFIPFYNGARYGAIHLHGHSHRSEEHKLEQEYINHLNSIGLKNKSYNVGCMYQNYFPWTIDEIIEKSQMG